METDQSDLKLWKIRNTVDNRIKFSYTATPREHLELFVANANRRSSGWKVGECVEGKEVTFEYNHTYILDGLNDFANQIGTEWQIINKTVHLRKVEYNKSSPLVLSYGKVTASRLVSGVNPAIFRLKSFWYKGQTEI